MNQTCLAIFLLGLTTMHFPTLPAADTPTLSNSPIQWLIKEQAIEWPRGVDETRLLDLFERIGVSIQRISGENWNEAVATQGERFTLPPVESRTLRTHDIWQGRAVKLMVTADGKIRISPTRSVRILADLSDREMIEMQETAIRNRCHLQKCISQASFSDCNPLWAGCRSIRRA